MANLTLSNTEVPFCGYAVCDGYTQEECDKLNSEKAHYVATTILSQMGGSRALKLMLGANNFSSHKDEGLGGLSFRFKGSRKANYLKVILAGNDTYSMRFARSTKGERYIYDVVEFKQEVYFDQLCEIFRDVTGLETRVPRIVGINA